MAVWWQTFKSGLIAAMAFASPAVSAELVSTSLCADAYVMALASPEQLNALSWQADGPLSLAKGNMRRLPKARPDTETLVALAPSLMVLGPGDKLASTRLAKRRGSDIHQIQWQDDFAGIASNLRALGEFAGMSAQAEKRIQQQNKMLQSLAERAHQRTRTARVLYLTPTLGTAGNGTFIDAAIQAAGANNLATELGIAGWGQIPIEQLGTARPDLIISSFFKDGPASAVQFRSNHPMIQTLRAQVPEVRIAGGLWVCAGPDLIKAASQIADALDRLPGAAP